MATEATPVRKSLLRKIAWIGADRRVVGLAGLIGISLGWTMGMGFGLLYGASILVPLLFFCVVLWVGREMYEKDPWMMDVLIKHFKYRKFYAAKPDRGIAHPTVKDYI